MTPDPCSVLDSYTARKPLTRAEQVNGLSLFLEAWKELAEAFTPLREQAQIREDRARQAFSAHATDIFLKLSPEKRIQALTALRDSTPAVQQQAGILLAHEHAFGAIEAQGAHPAQALAREEERRKRLDACVLTEKRDLFAHPATSTTLTLLVRFPAEMDRLVADPHAYPPPARGVAGWGAKLAARYARDPFTQALRQARIAHPDFDTTARTTIVPAINRLREHEQDLARAQERVNAWTEAAKRRQALDEQLISREGYATNLTTVALAAPELIAHLAREQDRPVTASRLLKAHGDWRTIHGVAEIYRTIANRMGALELIPDGFPANLMSNPRKTALQHPHADDMEDFSAWIKEGRALLARCTQPAAHLPPPTGEELPPNPLFQKIGLSDTSGITPEHHLLTKLLFDNWLKERKYEFNQHERVRERDPSRPKDNDPSVDRTDQEPLNPERDQEPSVREVLEKLARARMAERARREKETYDRTQAEERSGGRSIVDDWLDGMFRKGPS